MVIDTVAGAGAKLGYFYEHQGLASHTCRLLNVALSRAQDHLIVIADTQFLHSKLGHGSEAGRMLEHLERHAHKLSVEDLVPFRAAGDLAELPEDELARPAFFPARGPPRRQMGHRPRPSEHRYLLRLPRPAAGTEMARPAHSADPRRVQVTVHTRHQSEDPRRQALVRDLETAGCKIAIRDRMHEKVLIIDDRVLWHGSLNLLANIGPTDLMMRITDPTACQRVRHIVNGPGWNGPPAPGVRSAGRCGDGVRQRGGGAPLPPGQL